jgi:hypothetical protein
MTITIVDRRITFTEADTVTGWSGHKTPVIYNSAPAPVEAPGSIGVAVSNETGFLYFTTSSISFSTGSGAGTLVYVWVLANGIMDTKANGGIGIVLGDGTNRVGYHLAGSDEAAFRHANGSVGWQCIVLDTEKLPTQRTVLAGASASLNFSAITQIGAQFKTLVKAVGGVENCFVDVIRYGNNGLQIYGGTSGSDPGTFEQIVNEDVSSTSGKAYGIVRKLGTGTYGVQGLLTFGDFSGSNNTWFEDKNAVVLFEDRNLAKDKYKMIVTGSLSNNTTFLLGKKSGTGESATGTDGCIVQVAISSSAELIASNIGVDKVGLYGTTMIGFKEGLTFSSTVSGSNFELISDTFRACGQVDIGTAFTRNCVFTAYTASNAALLWNPNINIKNSTFNLNTNTVNDPAGIMHTTSGTFTYDNLKFSGNDYDIFNSSSGLVTINSANGSNPATSRNSAGSSTSIVNSVSHTISGLQTDSRVIWIRVSDDVELYNTTETSGLATYAYNYAGDTAVDIQIISLGYKNKIISTTLASVNATIPASQELDKFYFNPT